MPYDIYGDNLRNGFCEVHPYVEQEYPCQICWQEIEREKQRQREHRENLQLQNEQYHLHSALQQIEKLEEEKKELLEALEKAKNELSQFKEAFGQGSALIPEIESIIQKHK